MDFSALFQPLRIGSLELANRLVAGPVVSNLADEHGYVTSRMIEYYREKALGGWGLVNVEAASVSLNGPTFNRMLGIYSRRHVSGLSELADAMHEAGAPCTLQIMHGGRGTSPLWINGDMPVAPSDDIPPLRGVKARGLGAEEIEMYIEDFVNAAVWTREAGFDSVVIHGTHGFLINQFMSRYTNHRTDKWGEPLAFPLAIIRGIRNRVGSGYPVFFRITGDEYMGEKGFTINDVVRWAPELVGAGVDALDVSAGNRETYIWTIQPMSFPRGCLVHLAEAVKRVVDVPVVIAGRINDPKLALDIVTQKKADLVVMARGSLCDPNIPKKLAGEDPESIRQCVACNVCLTRSRTQKVIRCMFNFSLGRPKVETEIKAAPVGGRIVVIGAGPAGLEAARVAGLRGFQVTVFERSLSIGGALHLAVAPPGKSELANIIDYYSREMHRLGVELRLGESPSAEDVDRLSPKAVIMATGAVPKIPDIPGVEGSHVFHANLVLSGKVKVGPDVAIIGGAEVGCETAECLLDQGAMVTLMRRGKELAEDLEPMARVALLERLESKGLKVFLGVRYERIAPDGVIIYESNGMLRHIRANHVVLATGYNSNNELLTPLREKGLKVYPCGDAKEVRLIIDAIHEASLIARRI